MVRKKTKKEFGDAMAMKDFLTIHLKDIKKLGLLSVGQQLDMSFEKNATNNEIILDIDHNLKYSEKKVMVLIGKNVIHKQIGVKLNSSTSKKLDIEIENVLRSIGESVSEISNDIKYIYLDIQKFSSALQKRIVPSKMKIGEIQPIIIVVSNKGNSHSSYFLIMSNI